jgi:hypothetical protein
MIDITMENSYISGHTIYGNKQDAIDGDINTFFQSDSLGNSPRFFGVKLDPSYIISKINILTRWEGDSDKWIGSHIL